MDLSEQTLLDLLKTSNPHFHSSKANSYILFTPIQMAHLYIRSAFLGTVMAYVKEQLWLQNKADKAQGEVTPYGDFITPIFNSDLASILFLKEYLIECGPTKIGRVTQASNAIEASVLSLIVKGSYADQKDFAIQSLKEMAIHFRQEEKRQEGRLQYLGHSGPCLYRTFDNLDDVFALNYRLDKDMVVERSVKERLYQGFGAAVQSGYSTILLALQHIELASGSKVVDMGSGYGRVGLVFSLLHPDIDFTGYEYVPHRVEASNHTCRTLGLQDSLSFEVQDLSLASFNLPIADVYYLYDPFTSETYHKVLRQIVEVSRSRKITIVTKGNARHWIIDIANENSWPSSVSIDEGNLCIFSSS